ncbi:MULTISPECIES: prolipoprotein diacylglyceryl transferase [Microbacterium]|uniref:prolipoprotein diacylglyceryl transferase n=1 Tax=Microbacterium TaxID=33882 RepID=UPI0019CF723A|nr:MULTISPECIES: prolipoprotein diacylglyceryl transferase family protein [Microbacterium]MCE7480672.1 prolipoprotein diacylglyceryl transferase [Microbacterium profundi]
MTYEFRAASDGDPYSVAIEFEGRRMGVKHTPGTGDLFKVATTVERVLPGSGRIAVTTRVPNVKAGSWRVVARPSAHHIGVDRESSRDALAVLPRLPGASAEGSTGWAAVIAQKAPGVLLGSWAALVALGAAVALGVQGVLAALLGLSVVGVGLVSLVASLIGLVGAKLYYLAVYPAARRRALSGGGMCIQGFVLGAAVGLIVGALVAGIDLGSLLDITAPALMFGMTIGRFGCLLSGCCVGRPTASRWGLWSSDRRLGVRRIPTQLLESALAAIIGGTALGVLVIAGLSEFPGTIFIGALAAYVLGRQLLLPLRAESSKTRYGRVITLATAATVLLVDVVVAITIYVR